MRIQSPSKPEMALPRPLPRKLEPGPAAPIWKPQEVGLTRQELRTIVIDLIG